MSKRAGSSASQTRVGYLTPWHTQKPECVQASWSRPQYPLSSLGLGASCARLDCSTRWQAQDLGLGRIGPGRETGYSSSGLQFPLVITEVQDVGLGKMAAPLGMCVDLALGSS